MNLLITGGTGFIGSHTCLLLLAQGYDLVIFDSFVNSSAKVLDRLGIILKFNNDYLFKRITLIRGDIRDKKKLIELFSSFESKGKSINGVLHFAGLKSVSDSVINPLEYCDVNLSGTKNLLQVMNQFNCKIFVFSSSATIYAPKLNGYINEEHEINPMNPYGRTKAAVEYLLADLYSSDNTWSIASLRYFNPVGAHHSGMIGEDPFGIPNNLFPFISQVAAGRLDKLRIYGSNWPTFDGTGVRDYVHVIDLADGHICALNYLLNNKVRNFIKLNLGSGKGYSVLEVINTYSNVIGRSIPYEIVDRRLGDNAFSVADPSLAKDILGWETKKSLIDMCKDSWNWQKNNPQGYS